MADLPEEILMCIFQYSDIKSMCNARISCKYLFRWIDNSDLYKSSKIYIKKVLDPSKPIIRQIKRCYERRYIDFEMRDIGVKQYGSKFLFWNNILNEPLRMWSPMMKGFRLQTTPYKYILEWVSDRTSMTQFEQIFRHYLPHIMTKNIENCRDVRPYSVTLSNRGTYLRSSVERSTKAWSILPAKRKFGDGINNVKERHIPTVYYSRSGRFVRRSYHALQCMKINPKDDVSALVKWDCWKDKSGFGTWAVKCSFEKVRVYRG